MLTFFHKKKKIVIDAFTHDVIAHECAPICKASKTLPKWWKDLSSYSTNDILQKGDSVLNMKRCYGFNELYKKSFIVRNTSDLSIKIFHDKCTFIGLSDRNPEIHPKSQYGNGFPNHNHIKLILPWILTEKIGIKVLFFSPEFNLDNYNIKILPGIVDLSLPTAIHVNIMIPVKKDIKPDNIILPIGLPIYQFIPLIEENVEIKNHLISVDDFYTKYYKQRSYKRYDELIRLAKENKCPFSGGDNDY